MTVLVLDDRGELLIAGHSGFAAAGNEERCRRAAADGDARGLARFARDSDGEVGELLVAAHSDGNLILIFAFGEKLRLGSLARNDELAVFDRNAGVGHMDHPAGLRAAHGLPRERGILNVTAVLILDRNGGQRIILLCLVAGLIRLGDVKRRVGIFVDRKAADLGRSISNGHGNVSVDRRVARICANRIGTRVTLCKRIHSKRLIRE